MKTHKPAIIESQQSKIKAELKKLWLLREDFNQIYSAESNHLLLIHDEKTNSV